MTELGNFVQTKCNGWAECNDGAEEYEKIYLKKLTQLEHLRWNIISFDLAYRTLKATRIVMVIDFTRLGRRKKNKKIIMSTVNGTGVKHDEAEAVYCEPS